MTISKLSDTISHSNRSVEKLARKIINESSNAVLMEMFEDKVLLADHTNGNIYTADYSFDGNTFVFENFENIELEKESDSLREAVNDYFNEEVVDTDRISEAISEEFEKDDNELQDSIVEALASKNTKDVIDYSPLCGINEELDELKETSLFEEYSALLEERPVSTIHYVDFVHPVKVSVLDEDEERVIYSDISDKVKKFTKDSEAKKALLEAIKEYKETDDASIIEEFVEKNEMIMALNESDLKEFVGMSVLGEPKLAKERKELAAEINKIIEESEYLSDKKSVISEALEDAEDEGDTDEDKEAKEKDAKLAAKDSDIEKLKKALETAADKIEDEKLLSKINALLTAIDSGAANNETDVGAIKESIAILSL